MSVAEPSEQGLAITLTPVTVADEVRAVDVLEVVHGLNGRANTSLFQVPVRVTTIQGQAYRQGDVVAEDSEGALPLRMAEDPRVPGSPLQMRSFSPVRDTHGDITLRYRADVAPANQPRVRGPSFDLRGAAGGFGGAFFPFLLLPTAPSLQLDFGLHWNLGSLPVGALGVSTKGEGDVRSVVPSQEVTTIFLLAGKLGAYSPQGSLFHAYWIGSPPFDARAASEWSARSFSVLREFFGDQATSPFYLFMRPSPLIRDGGGATHGGFMLEYGVGYLSDASRRFMFTHEMIHHFLGQFDDASSGNAWYGEGLAEFYKFRLPLRDGLASLDATAYEIGVMTNAYYMSTFVDVPYQNLASQRWSDRSAQMVPYNRAFMYFAHLNALIQKHSSGARSLDDLIRAMLERKRAGKPYDEAAWRDLLRAELGKEGIDDLDAMLAGRLIVPEHKAFGPCFQRHERLTARRTLGFDENSVLIQPYIVAELQSGSAAERAGLREGDTIVKIRGVRARVAHSAPNVVLDPAVQLEVQREDGLKTIRFSTEGPKVTEFYWTASTSRSGSCGF